MSNHQDVELLKGFLDGVSVIAVIGALTQVLPAVAALFTIIWTGIRIYESKTVQDLLNRNNTAVTNDYDAEEKD